jgi:hypothetical protein
MSKATTKARIQAEITTALANDSITPVIVGSILDELLELNTPVSSKIYKAIFYQNDEGVLSIQVLQNTLGGLPVLTKLAVGYYKLELANAFPDLKTFCKIQNNFGASINYIGCYAIYKDLYQNNVLHIETAKNGIPTDMFSFTCVEIEVFE